MRSFHKNQRRYHLFSILSLVLLLISLFGCGGSSDTRSQARSSTSGEYEVNVEITAPVNGSVLSTASDVTFVAATSGGAGSSGTGNTATITLTWQIVGPTTQNTASGDTPTLTFIEPGSHRVTVTATDTRGQTATDSITVFVGGAGTLVVQITSPANGATVTGSSWTFTASTAGGVGDPSLTWQFIGPTTRSSGTGSSSTFTFLESGAHTVIVTATDTQGTTVSDSITITVGGTGTLSVQIASPVDGATLTLSSSTSSDFTGSSAGGVGSITLTWQTQGPTTANTATGTTPTLTFSENGTHVIRLTGTDSLGSQASDTITIQITGL